MVPNPQLFTLSSDRRSCRSTAFAFAPSTWVATKQPDVFGRLASGFKVEKTGGFKAFIVLDECFFGEDLFQAETCLEIWIVWI